ncbi:MAG: tetratricopeptide repeat protein [Kiritimatiellia bacterium]
MNKIAALLTHPLFWGIVSLVVYMTFLASWVFPGEAAPLMAQCVRAWQTTDVIAHPLVSLVFNALGQTFQSWVTPWMLNACSAIAGALCVFLVCQLVRNFLLCVTVESKSIPFVERAAAWAVPAAGITMILLPTMMSASTHFQWQTFDLFLVLLCCWLLLRQVMTRCNFWTLLAAFAWGLIAFEAAEIVLMTPFFLIAVLIGSIIISDRFHWVPLLLRIAIPFSIGLLLILFATAAMSLNAGFEGNLITASKVFIWMRMTDVLALFNGPWILIGFYGVLPFLLALLSAPRLCNNDRSFVTLFTHSVIVVLLAIALLPIAISPFKLATLWGEVYPLPLVAMTAFAVAYVIGANRLLLNVRHSSEKSRGTGRFRAWCVPLTYFLSLPLGVIVCISGIIGVVRVTFLGDRPWSNLARQTADTVLDSFQEETWILGDDVLDPYLALRIAERPSTPIVLLSQTANAKQQALMLKALEQSPYFATKPALRETLLRSLDIGLIPFIQDWMRNDPEAQDHFVTLSLPDLWYSGNCIPRPDRLWYRGVKSTKELKQFYDQDFSLKGAKAFSLWEIVPPKSSAFVSPSLRHFMDYLRRQTSFISNNQAFYLAECGYSEEAYRLFRETYAYYPENVSALFNCFELINGGLHPEERAWCEAEVNQLIQQLKGRKYQLWALARTYGYIRSPLLISALAGSWAMSGQTGAALSGLDIALEMLGEGQQDALQSAIAALYNVTPGKRQEAIRRYQLLLDKSTDKKQTVAYLRELIRLAVLEGNMTLTRELLERAEASSTKPSEFGYERAIYFASSGDLPKARICLQSYIEQFPKNLEANAMLATFQLQSDELDDLRAITLPKMISAAGTADNYYVKIVMAQLALKEKDLAKARAAYLRAYDLKPDVYALRETILALDIRLNDKEAAARHARQYLYQDRTLPIANYVMGALALGDGDMKRALSYLSVATAADVKTPIPEAYNDLAETYRRMGKWTQALSSAQRASELDPTLAISYETMASALLELGRFAEANTALDQAVKIAKPANPNQPLDPRFIITRARIQEKSGQIELARITLSEARPQREQLDAESKAEFDALAQRVGLR